MAPRSRPSSPRRAASSGPSYCITKGGRVALNEADPKEAARTHQVPDDPMNPITLIDEGRTHYRNIPVQQSLEDWNDFWSEYKNA